MSEILIKSLFSASCVFSAVLIVNIMVSFVLYVIRNVFGKGKTVNARYKPLKTRLLLVSMLFVGAVWCLRFAVGYYSAYHPADPSAALTPVEEIFNSLVHTLQTFSLDEDYTQYINSGKTMMTAVFGEGSWLIGFYGIYAAVLNFLVPVAGGAILFELISEFSPKIRLFFANLRFWNKKYYFSELNENSLALANSIVAYKKRNVCLIFTDAYAANDDENGSEYLAQAKSLGAICVKDDLMHIRLHGIIRTAKIFLIDKSENNNLQTLAALFEKNNIAIRRSEIYVFSSDSIYSHLDEETAFVANKRALWKYGLLSDKKKERNKNNAYKALSKEAKKDHDTKWSYDEKEDAYKDYYIKNNMPAVIPVNGVRNMITNLFANGIPLYEPVIDKAADKDGKKTLNLTILGSGVIGTEAFLTAYWCGQMLDCRLKITVISMEKQNNEKDKADGKFSAGTGSFEGRINYINPDILMTKDPKSPLLKYSDKKEPSEPYFDYDYKEINVLSDDFITLMNKSGLLDTDYFVVALGSDEENFSVANRLRQIVGEHHLFNAPANKTVISYVIYNSDLACALNKDHKHKYSLDPGKCDIIMYAFGSLDNVYSVESVFFEGKAGPGYRKTAYSAMRLYDMKKKGLNEEEHKKEKAKIFKDIYAYQANLARCFHRKYMEYSAGFHKISIFNSDDEKLECFDKPEEDYLKYIVCEEMVGNKTKEKLTELAWLEHRRWCAYMRIKGYRNLDKEKNEDFTKYFYKHLPEHSTKDHKLITLKLHPCIAEFDINEPIKADFGNEGDRKGVVLEKTEFNYPDEEYYNDNIDILSLQRHKLDKDKEDFKRWDYPQHNVSDEEIRNLKNAEEKGKKRNKGR